MGYFLQKFGIKSFNEAEADGQDINNTNNQPTDYTEDDTNRQSDENRGSESQDNTQYQQQDSDTTPENNQTTDYTEEDAQYQDNTEDEEINNSENQTPPHNDKEEQPVDDLKKHEEELYNNLSPDQLDIKHKELKNQFLFMYDITTSIIDRIGDAAISEENIKIAEYISNQLYKMREMLIDYIESVYKGKSYIENSINYNRFLAILNGINKMLEQLEKKEDN